MKLIESGNPILREVAEEVIDFEEAGQILDELEVLMREQEGVGMAAPQVGISKKIAIAEGDDWTVELINPEITFYGDKVTIAQEGCLSLPDLYLWVPRYRKVRVEYFDREGNSKRLRARGLLALSIQHEVDHLDGILIDKRGVTSDALTSLETSTEGANTSKADKTDSSVASGSNSPPGLRLHRHHDRHTKSV